MNVRSGWVEVCVALGIASLGAFGCEGEHRPYVVTLAVQADGGMEGGSNGNGRTPGVEDRVPSLGSSCTVAGDCVAVTCPESTECRIQGQAGLDSTQAVSLDAGVIEPACPGCLIEGECMAARAPNPENPCQLCDPARKVDGWTASEGNACDDGLFCTIDDECDTEGKCNGSPQVRRRRCVQRRFRLRGGLGFLLRGDQSMRHKCCV